MTEYDVQVGSVGVPIELTIRDKRTGELVDLTDATVLKMRLRGPQGATLERTATAPSPTNGVVRYVTVAGDLQYHGRNQAQAFATFDDGSMFPSSIYEFDVGPNL